MPEQPDSEQLALRRAAEEGIHFAVKNDENRHAALGRMVDLLDKYEAVSAERQAIIQEFEHQMQNMEEASQLHDE